MDRKNSNPSDAVISWKTLTKSGDEIIWENGENRILFQNKQVTISLMKQTIKQQRQCIAGSNC